MSRVERKKLEKEMKKSNRVFKFKKESSAPKRSGSLSENKMKTQNPETKNEKKESVLKDNKAIARAITADKIVSLEDERMYFEIKQRKGDTDVSSSEFMTVDDIITLEDEENGVNFIPEETIKDEVDASENINDIKKIHIEKAPFEDVVRVAESRLQAEEKISGEELNMEESKKNEESGKLLNSIDSVNKASIDDLYENLENKSESKSKSNESEPKNEKKEGKNQMKKSKDNLVVKKSGKNGGGFKKFLLGLFGIIVVVYALGCLFFNGRYYANTKINGIDAGLKTPAKVEELAAAKADGYSLKLSGRKGVNDTIKGSDIDLKFVNDGSAESIKKNQGMFGWPIAIFSGESIDGKLNIEYDEAKLSDIESKLNINDKKNITAPKSAVPKYDESKKELLVDKGDLGSTPIKSELDRFIDQSLKSQKTNAKYPDSAYKEQKYNENSVKVKKAVAKLKPYVDTKVVYDFEYEKYQIKPQEIVSMFDLDEEGDYNVELSKDKVREVVRNLSRKYSTYGDTREINSVSTGGKLKVSGGFYGWLIDREKETDALYKIIEKKENANNRKPIYAQTAVSRQKDDMGDEFIEIDLSKQHMWYVKGGDVLVSTPVVTGNPYHGDATPPGIYPLNYKTRHATLRGPGYASPVSYWMPFNGDIGIHDASWQPVYGGSRYLYAGSHGCINTPYSQVAKIYNLAKEGMPVIVHN